MKNRKSMRRGASRRDNPIFIGAWIPEAAALAIDSAVRRLDLDRSKFLRRALEEKIAKHAAPDPAPAKS